MLHYKTKKTVSRVSVVVLLTAFLFQTLITIPRSVASVSAAVTPSDISAQGAEEVPVDPDPSEDPEDADRPTADVMKIPLKAPMAAFAENVYAYQTTMGSSVTFNELLTALGLSEDRRNAFHHAEAVSEGAVANLGLDTAGKTITPKRYDTVEMVDFYFDEMPAIHVKFTDSIYTDNLGSLCTDIRLIVNGKSYSADDVGATVAVSGKKLYDMMIKFAETPDVQFSNYETLYFDLPIGFTLPEDFNTTNHTVDINMRGDGILRDNKVTCSPDGKTVYLEWNRDDAAHFRSLCGSANTQFTLVLSGKLDPDSGKVIFSTDKELNLTKEDLHNAFVTKTADYPQGGSTISYTVTVTSDGTTDNLVLTDERGYALGEAVLGENAFEYKQGNLTKPLPASPFVEPNGEGKLVISIPHMDDEDVLTIRYSCPVDFEKIQRSGHATEEETGNTVTIVGDNDPSDNVAQAHVSNITFGSINKISKGKQDFRNNGKYYSVINWYAETNTNAQMNLAGSTLTDIMGDDYSAISAYHGDGVTVRCYDKDGNLKETRVLSWDFLGVNPETDKTWTYTLPDDEPNYEYQIEYQTRVQRDGLTQQILVTNTIVGKCGDASGVEPIDPLGDLGYGVSKSVTNVESNHATWKVNVKVVGEDNLNSPLRVEEDYSVWKDENEQLQTRAGMPLVSIPYYDSEGVADGDNFYHAEWLETLVVSGLTPNEQFRATYTTRQPTVTPTTHDNWRSGRTVTIYAYSDGTSRYSDDAQSSAGIQVTRSADGSTVTMTGFPKTPGYRWEKNDLSIEFYKNDTKEGGEFVNGGLTIPAVPDNPPSDYQPERTVSILMTDWFSDDWVNDVSDYCQRMGSYQPNKYTHTNWALVYGDPDPETGTLALVARDNASFITHPINLYKRQLYNGTNVEINPVATDNQGNVLHDSYGNEIVFPVYQYYVAINGINSDGPIVIEDTFDTSVFSLFDARQFYYERGENDVRNGLNTYVRVEKYPGPNNKKPNAQLPSNCNWVDWLNPTFAGQTDILNTTPSNTYGKAVRIDNDSCGDLTGSAKKEKILNYTENGYRVMESDHMKVEETATGARFTFKDLSLFKKENGSYYPFYVVNYYLMPRDVQAIAELDRRALDSGDIHGSVSFNNVASCRGKTTSAIGSYKTRNGFTPLMKTYLQQKSNDQPIDKIDFTIEINPHKLCLNNDYEMEVTDTYSDSLSVDYTSIKFVTDPADAAEHIRYDYRGNTGIFIVPDRTHVTITYTATLLTDPDNPGASVHFDNTVSAVGYDAGISTETDVKVRSAGELGNPSVHLFKYRSGHMEKGLNGAVFELLTDKLDDEGNVVYQADGTTSVKVPVMNTNVIPNEPMIFTTGPDAMGKDGYVKVQLDQTLHGSNLKYDKAYYLHEITAPTGYAADGIEYKFSFDEQGVINYSEFVYLDGDVLKIRNNPEYIDTIVTKEIKGNVELTETDKETITFKLEKWNAETSQWEDYIPKGETVSPYSAITYAQFAENSTYTFGRLTAGRYRITESGNQTVRTAHEGSNAYASYLWDDNVGGSSQNQDAITTEFSITAANLQNGDARTVTFSNTYSIVTVDKKVIKRWYNPDGTQINWPTGLKVKLGVYRYENGEIVGDPVQTVTLDGAADKDGELIPGQATFSDLPEQKVVTDGNGQIILVNQAYAVKELTSFNGYVPEAENGVMAFYDPDTGTMLDQVEFKNRKTTISFTFTKTWDPMPEVNPAEATFRLFSYAGTDVSKARMVQDIELPRTGEGVTDANKWTATIENLPKVNDQDVPLHYIVKEINCTAGYEAAYPSNTYYATDNETVTNRPAKTDFNVTVQWEDIPSNQWPKGITLNLTLQRRPKGGGDADPYFALDFSLPGSGEDAELTVTNSASGETFDAKQTKRSNIKYELDVKDLIKYSPDGALWEYYIAQEIDNTPQSGIATNDISTAYFNQNRAVMDDDTTNRGLITNKAPTVSISVSKEVAGTFASRFADFTFTITLGDDNTLSGQFPFQKFIGPDDRNPDTGEVTFTNGKATFKLKHNQKIEIGNISPGTAYTVTENTTNGYISEVLSGETEGTVANNTVSFRNTREGTVPTGVAVGVTGAGAVLLLSAGGFLLLLRRKAAARKQTDQAETEPSVDDA